MKRLMGVAMAALISTPAVAGPPSLHDLRDLTVRLVTLKQVAIYCTEELMAGQEGPFCRRQRELISPTMRGDLAAIMDPGSEAAVPEEIALEWLDLSTNALALAYEVTVGIESQQSYRDQTAQ